MFHTENYADSALNNNTNEKNNDAQNPTQKRSFITITITIIIIIINNNSNNNNNNNNNNNLHSCAGGPWYEIGDYGAAI